MGELITRTYQVEWVVGYTYSTTGEERQTFNDLDKAMKYLRELIDKKDYHNQFNIYRQEIQVTSNG